MSWAALRSSPSRMRSDSVIWRPTRTTGLSAVIGSWKTMAICVPQTSRSSAGDMAVRSWPDEAHRARALHVGAREQAHDRAAEDRLARARLAHHAEGRPRSKVNETPSTARTSPRPRAERGVQVLDLEERALERSPTSGKLELRAAAPSGSQVHLPDVEVASAAGRP